MIISWDIGISVMYVAEKFIMIFAASIETDTTAMENQIESFSIRFHFHVYVIHCVRLAYE